MCRAQRLAHLHGNSSTHLRRCMHTTNVPSTMSLLLLPPARRAPLQICAGVSHMHSRGFAHMDLKPHNVLIKRPATSQQQQQRLLTAAANTGSIPRPGSRPRIRATALPDSDEEVDLEAGASLVSQLCRILGRQGPGPGWGSVRQGKHMKSRSACQTRASAAQCGCTSKEDRAEATQQHTYVSARCAVLRPVQVARGYQAVVMDFGSARRMPVTVSSRQQALTVQEDAEVCVPTQA